ncbi:hypothetical protein ACQKWADRAFT_321007 [Trichoderma austrokoningii]
MKLRLNWCEGQAPVTEEVVEEAAANHGKVIAVLLNQKEQIPITEQVLKMDAYNPSGGVFESLLNRFGDLAPITEDVRMWLLLCLPDKYGDRSLVTKEVEAAAAARNENHGGYQVPANEEVVMAAARNENLGEEVVLAAAENRSSDNKVLGLLFNRLGEDQIPVTEGVVKAAAGNTSIGYRLLNRLFDWFGDQTPISEEVVRAAAANYGNVIVMELLLGRSRPQITEDVIPITMEVIKKQAENDREDRKSKKETWKSRKQCATTPQIAYPANKNARVKGSYKLLHVSRPLFLIYFVTCSVEACQLVPNNADTATKLV